MERQKKWRWNTEEKKNNNNMNDTTNRNEERKKNLCVRIIVTNTQIHKQHLVVKRVCTVHLDFFYSLSAMWMSMMSRHQRRRNIPLLWLFCRWNTAKLKLIFKMFLFLVQWKKIHTYTQINDAKTCIIIKRDVCLVLTCTKHYI